MKKTNSLIILISIIMLGFSYPAEAATTCTPTITVSEVKDTKVKLDVICDTAKNSKVAVNVQFKNKDTNGKSHNKVFTGKASKSGMMRVSIDGLDTGTAYEFKAKVKSSGSSVYSTSSAVTEATTKGSSYKPTIDGITSVTDSSAKITVNTSGLKKKQVNLQVLYRKKSAWTTKDFTITLDSDGDGKVTITGLSSDTKYDFKVRIKKTTDSKYSSYSETKSVTTDE